MMTEPQLPRSERAVPLIGFLSCICLSFIVDGCARPAQPTSSTRQARQAENALDSISDTLRKGNDLEACRNVIRQINNQSSRREDTESRSLSKEQEELLRTFFGLDAQELAEAGSNVFTLLDVHHLELCFLLRDAVRSLRMDSLRPQERAAAAFAWTVRQVGLRERPGEPLPPQFVLRRGLGTAQERALVFLAMLQQLGIHGCMVAMPPGAPTSAAPYWAGALIDNEIYLFDTRLGLPLPGSGGKGIATLSQVVAQPDLLQVLSVDGKYPYDVTPQQVKNAEVYLASPLSALAPRMEYLQTTLAATEGVNVWVDLSDLLKSFQGATTRPNFTGKKLQVWSLPLRALRSYLPATEGGVGKADRQQQTLAAVDVPWPYFPRELLDLGGEPGQRLRQLFASPFIYLYMEPRMPRELLMTWLPGLFQPTGAGLNQARIPDLVQHERMPRDLMLRGRFDEATNVLVSILEELRRQRAVPMSPGGDVEVRLWRDEAVRVYGTLLQLERQAANPKAQATQNPAALADAKKRVAALWQNSGKVQDLVRRSAAQPMVTDVLLLMALCKQEQADRLEERLNRSARTGKRPTSSDAKAARDAWKSAAGWWETFLEGHGSSPNAPAARLLRARALEAIGEKEGAIALLEDLSGDLTNLEKTARLYLARRLKEHEAHLSGKAATGSAVKPAGP
jgi:hypothetical protein